MGGKHRKTYDAIFDTPVRSNIKWKDVEKLIEYLGGRIYEGSGSRVRLISNEVVAVFHRPHPGNETDKGAVKDMRDFLREAGIKF